MGKVVSIKANKTPAMSAQARRDKALFNLESGERGKVLTFQDNKCAITKLPSRRLSMDHCHKTGLVRGLIDWNINRSLAAFNDNPQWLRNAADFLERPTVSQALGEDVYGVVGKISRKAKNRRYGPTGSITPQPRTKKVGRVSQPKKKKAA